MNELMQNPEVAGAAGIAISMLGTALVKKLSKSKSSLVHKWVCPAVAVATGIGYTSVTGLDADMGAITEGTAMGGAALVLHTFYKAIRDAKAKKEGAN